MSKPFFVMLPGRGTVRIEGADARSFLQGLVSNDVLSLAENAMAYACLLTPQGKFLHDFFMVQDGDALLLDCEGGDRAKDLHNRLSNYRLRSKVTLGIEEETPVYSVWNADSGMSDPRSPAMGRRIRQKPDMEERPFAEWDTRRIALCIPDGSRDMEIEKSTLLECHIDRLNGIDWNKGCYMGQELTARMHYRGLAKKHLRVVAIKDEASSPFSDLPDGGQTRSSCGNIGLALLKDDRLYETDHGAVTPLKEQPWP